LAETDETGRKKSTYIEDEYCLQDADKHKYIIVSNVMKYNTRLTKSLMLKESLSVTLPPNISFAAKEQQTRVETKYKIL
jgi:hypothetical protein